MYSALSGQIWASNNCDLCCQGWEERTGFPTAFKQKTKGKTLEISVYKYIVGTSNKSWVPKTSRIMLQAVHLMLILDPWASRQDVIEQVCHSWRTQKIHQPIFINWPAALVLIVPLNITVYQFLWFYVPSFILWFYVPLPLHFVFGRRCNLLCKPLGEGEDRKGGIEMWFNVLNWAKNIWQPGNICSKKLF